MGRNIPGGLAKDRKNAVETKVFMNTVAVSRYQGRPKL